MPGIADLRIQQAFDQPKLHIVVDRTKAAESGFTQRDVASSMLISLSGSFQTTPTFWLNPQNGVNYSVVTQTPQYDVQIACRTRRTFPSRRGRSRQPEILGDVASITRGTGMAVVIPLQHSARHRYLRLGAGPRSGRRGARRRPHRGRRIARTCRAARRSSVRGQIETMQTSFTGLLGGLVFAIVLVYLLIVVNFQSWLDPFIIITALPAALAGIVLFLFVTHTTLSVPALMGAIMCMGVATANSILVVSFAKERLAAAWRCRCEAAMEAGFTRFRPVLMTALAMIIGMVPMALGLGEGGEQNAPLGRAVIGGLMCATVATLTFRAGGFRPCCIEPKRDLNEQPANTSRGRARRRAYPSSRGWCWPSCWLRGRVRALFGHPLRARDRASRRCHPETARPYDASIADGHSHCIPSPPRRRKKWCFPAACRPSSPRPSLRAPAAI